MSGDLWEWNTPARTYSVRPDGRVEFRVILTVGEEAKALTPWHDGNAPMTLDAVEIARDCDLPLREVCGREYTGIGDEKGLRDFRLVNDPRV
ncbi:MULTISPECIES: hypothetical protein [unclassified Nocardia]|uniref:hypothetical protein n=1 Tax=unclassified Nocardia TaxID=2637762 RepID=UPI00278C0983|nr:MULTISPECIES: hypothetical protein [unclassified Nocardia]